MSKPHAALAAAFTIALYTQFAHFLSVPGLHFDEAWQAMYAHRILNEAGFWPVSAMNSYTSPVLHYALAVVFKLFGPTLLALRGAYAAMNLTALTALTALLWRLGEHRAAAWFALLWALLPLSVHDHRFYVEMTGFHGLCLAATLWGVALWRRRPALSFALILVSIVAGTYSHILYVSVLAGGLLTLPRFFPDEFRGRRARALVAALAVLLVPLPLRMGSGLRKALPFALAAGLGLAAALALLAERVPRLRRAWHAVPRFTARLPMPLAVCALPFLVAFVGLHWNGSWPYAQATGALQAYWLPLNAALFLGVAWMHARRAKMARASARLSPELTGGAFLATFLVASLLILKQSPRYYMVPAILAMTWSAQWLARIRSAALQAAIAIAFVAWNLIVFRVAYVDRFERSGPTNAEFRLGPFHDNGRDFRPFQKVFAWAVENGCQADLRWVEDDRFLFPVEFLRLTAPKPGRRCPWPGKDLFLSHIPGYDSSFKGTRADANTPPPFPNVKFLAHFPEWGDLAVWIRR